MTERVTIEGRNLAVTVDQDNDPKRLRPKAYTPTTGLARSKEGRTLEQIIAEPNPYWPEQLSMGHADYAGDE